VKSSLQEVQHFISKRCGLSSKGPISSCKGEKSHNQRVKSYPMGTIMSQQGIHVKQRLKVLPNKWNNLSQVVGQPPSSMLVSHRHPPKDQGINQVGSQVKSIIQGSLLIPIMCVSTEEKEYFPRNPSRSMCNGIWYDLEFTSWVAV
jgi:hypothetical protein